VPVALSRQLASGGAVHVPQLLARGQQTPWGIAIDATSVYGTNFNGHTVMKVPLDGGASVTLASEQNFPHWIAVDETGVYWVNQGNVGSTDGTVMKVSK
jgi:hypothetical protein